MKKIIFLLFLSVFVQAKTLNIKIASTAPENTPWGQELKRIAQEWSKISDGMIKVTIFPGGIAGTEGQAMKKMKLGQFQGVVLTTWGLSKIDKSIMDFSAPGIFQTHEEVSYVLDKERDHIIKNFEKKRYALVFLGMGGWTYVFSTKKVYTPDETRRTKFGIVADATEFNTVIKNMGYNTVPVSISDILMSLNGGILETYMSSPILVAVQQLFAKSKYMIDMPIAPFLGGLVISKKVWRRIPKDLQKKMIEAAKISEDEIKNSTLQLEANAIKTMEKYGFKVLKTTDEQKSEWRKEFSKGVNLSKKGVFNVKMLDEITSLLKDYRK